MKRRKRLPSSGVQPESLECRTLLATFEVSPGESIQAAIDSADNGDTIQINEGIYDEDLLIQDKSLKLVGVGDVTLTGRNLPGAIGLKAKGGKSLSVTNIDFSMFSLAFDAEELTSVKVSDVDAAGNGLGVYFSTVQKVQVNRLSSTLNGGGGLVFTDVKTATMKDSDVSDNSSDGIDLNRVGKAKLDNITANRNGHDGLEARSTGSLIVTNSAFSSNGGGIGQHGIELRSIGKTAKLKNVTAGENADTGIKVQQIGSAPFGKAVVTDSVFLDNGQSGMDFSFMKTVVVNRSTANENGEDGLNVDAGGRVTVKNSEFARNVDDGIDILNTVFKQVKVNAFDNGDEDIVEA